MSAEDRWADRLEWEAECGEIEIKRREDITDNGDACVWTGCRAEAIRRYIIGPVTHHDGHDIDLCRDHDGDDNAYEVYARMHKED